MAPQHTAGPWSVESPLDCELSIVEQDKPVHEWRFIASIPLREGKDESNFPRNVAHANALVIAAAPDLLEACRTGLAALIRERDALLESCCLLDSDGNPRRETLDPGAADDVAELDAAIRAAEAAIAKAEGRDA